MCGTCVVVGTPSATPSPDLPPDLPSSARCSLERSQDGAKKVLDHEHDTQRGSKHHVGSQGAGDHTRTARGLDTDVSSCASTPLSPRAQQEAGKQEAEEAGFLLVRVDKDDTGDNAHAPLLQADGGRKGKRKEGKYKKKESVFLGYCSNTSVLLMRELLANWCWRQVDKQSESRFVWMDPSHANRKDLLTSICKSQRVNFLPGMKEMCNKKPLYRLLNRAKKMGDAKDVFFFPPTFVLPEDYTELDLELQKKKPKTYICKPDGGAQGAGIFLLRSGQEHKLQPGDKYVVQRYIHRPLLLDGFTFDLRLYVLITSVDPLRCYLFNDGLARFCTQPYAAPNSKNMDQVYIHLTNYSLNKFNKQGFVKNDEDTEDTGSKRSVQTVFQQMQALGHDSGAVWEDIKKLCLRTVAIKYPHLWQSYHATVSLSPPLALLSPLFMRSNKAISYEDV